MLSCDDATGPFGWMSRGACQARIPSCFPVTTHGAALRQVSEAKASLRRMPVLRPADQPRRHWGRTPEERRAPRPGLG